MTHEPTTNLPRFRQLCSSCADALRRGKYYRRTSSPGQRSRRRLVLRTALLLRGWVLTYVSSRFDLQLYRGRDGVEPGHKAACIRLACAQVRDGGGGNDAGGRPGQGPSGHYLEGRPAPHHRSGTCLSSCALVLCARPRAEFRARQAASSPPFIPASGRSSPTTALIRWRCRAGTRGRVGCRRVSD
jgi:hypothetical protein